MTSGSGRSTCESGVGLLVAVACVALLLIAPAPAAAQVFDPAFNAATNGAVFAIATQSDGKVVIGGAFTQVNGVTRSRLARLNADGSLDTTFTTGITAGSNVYALAVLSDGHILVGGDFSQVGGVARGRIARLNANGTLDSTFTTVVANDLAPAFGEIRAILVQPDDKILIAGGAFDLVNGVTRTGLARLNADGTLDGAFAPSFNGEVFALALQSSGAIVVGGSFSTANGIARVYAARLNAGGSLDTSFAPMAINHGGGNGVFAIAPRADGHILVGGEMTFQATSGEMRDSFVQLNTDGSLDLSFSAPVLPPTGVATRYVDAIVIQPDGRLLIAGLIGFVDGVNTYAATRLFADGTFDSTFGSTGGMAAGNAVAAMVLQHDGKVLVGGTLGLTNIARLLGVFFTDDPLQGGLTIIRAAHIMELRTRIDAVRIATGLSGFAWTDATLTPGVTVVKVQHIQELRDALSDAYVAASMTPPVYTDATLIASTTIVRAVHITELRNAVVTLESATQ